MSRKNQQQETAKRGWKRISLSAYDHENGAKVRMGMTGMWKATRVGGEAKDGWLRRDSAMLWALEAVST